MNRSGQGCAAIIAILMIISFMGRGSGGLASLVILAVIVVTVLRQAQRFVGSINEPDSVSDRLNRPRPAPSPSYSGPSRSAPPRPRAEPPVIDIPAPSSVVPPPTYSQPVSGPTLDLRLSFEASDMASVARLVPEFVRDQVTIVDSGTRLLRAGWCEYAYRLRGPESVLRELCEYLDRPGFLNLSAFW